MSQTNSNHRWTPIEPQDEMIQQNHQATGQFSATKQTTQKSINAKH